MWGSFMSWCHILLSNLFLFHINNIQVNWLLLYFIHLFIFYPFFFYPWWTEEHTEYYTLSSVIAGLPQRLETKRQSSFLLKLASMWPRLLQCGIATESLAATSQTTTHAPSGRCHASVRPVGKALSFSREECCCILYHTKYLSLPTKRCMHTNIFTHKQAHAHT